MKKDAVTGLLIGVLKRWWCSLLLVPFVIYAVHQSYWTLRFNIFFAITYDFPFPVDIADVVISNFLLLVHEAGHTFFSVIGSRTVTILGGSLFEILLPVMILVYFIVNQKKTGIQLSCYLTGFAFLDVAAYVADAGARQLPLIGGLPKEAHDWYNLLTQWGMLEQDSGIAVVLATVGGVFFLTALGLPLFYREYEEVNLELKI
jgi:hypothetical protein